MKWYMLARTKGYYRSFHFLNILIFTDGLLNAPYETLSKKMLETFLDKFAIPENYPELLVNLD